MGAGLFAQTDLSPSPWLPAAAAPPAGAASGRTLKLSGIHASGVPDMDSTTPGKAQHADPYVVFQVRVGGQVFSAARTKHVLHAANPAWDDILELPLPEPAGPAAPPQSPRAAQRGPVPRHPSG